MVKKRIAVLLTLLIFICSTSVVWAQEQSIKKNQLNEIIEYALKNNKDLQQLDIEINKLEINLDNAKRTAEDTRNTNIPVGFAGSRQNQVQTELVKRDYYVKSTKYSYDSLVEKKEQTKEMLKKGIIQSYTTVLQIKNQKKYLEKSKDKLNRLIKITNLRLQLNMATELDMRTLEDQLKTIENQLSQLNITEKNTIAELKKLINAPEDYEIDFIDDFDIDEAQEYDIEALIEKAKETRLDLKQLKNAVELQEIKLKVYRAFYWETSSEVKLEKLALETAEKDLNDKIHDIELEIKNNLEKINLLRQTYLNSQITYQRTQDKCKIDKIRYDLGIISYLEFLDSELAVIDAYNKTREALFNYINTKVQFDLIYSYGL